MIEAATVSLSKLRPGDGINSRKHRRSARVKDLVASIKAIGLMTPLLVRPAPGDGGAFEIIDGNTRYQALLKIAGKKDQDVPVVIRAGDDASAHEASLAANVIREALHPADEFEAYKRLLDDGVPVPDIAARFGQSTKWVGQRLQLAALAPELREEWKAGKISAEQAEAFSSIPNHDRQRKVWKEISKARDSWGKTPDAIRRALSEGALSQTDSRVIFVGLQTYLDAGGTMTEDLFTDSRALTDLDLLDRLVAAAMTAVAEGYLAEGWAWAKPEHEIDVPEWQIPQIDLRPYMTAEEREAFAAAKYEWQRSKIAEPAKEKAADDPEARAKSGVVLKLIHDGTVRARLLCVLDGVDEDDDEGDGADDVPVAAAPAEAEPEAPAGTRLAQPVLERLGETMTLAISEVIAADRGVALLAIVATLKTKMESYGDCPVRISTSPWSGLAPKDRSMEKKWSDHYVALQALDHDGLIDELCRLASKLVDLTCPKYDSSRGIDWKASRQAIINTLTDAMDAETVRSSIASRFDPETFFTTVAGAYIDAAVIEMGYPPPKGKKPEKVAAAAARARETGWLPAQLRTPHYVGPKGGEL